MQYCRDLAFKDEPDYDKLRKLFKNLMEKNNWKSDYYDYDWVALKKDKKK